MTKITLRNKGSGFTQISNKFIENGDISNTAKAVYMYMISRPDGWQFYIDNIKNHVMAGRDAIMNAINELVSLRYLTKTQKRDADGKFLRNDYEIFYEPFTENPFTENPFTAKTTHTNTNNTNTDINKKESKISPSSKRDLCKKLYEQLPKSVSLSFSEFLKKRKDLKQIEENNLNDVEGFLRQLLAWQKEGYDLDHVMAHNLTHDWEQLHPPKNKQPDHVIELKQKETIFKQNCEWVFREFGGHVSLEKWTEYFTKVPQALRLGANEFIRSNRSHFIECIPQKEEPPTYKPKMPVESILEAVEVAMKKKSSFLKLNTTNMLTPEIKVV